MYYTMNYSYNYFLLSLYIKIPMFINIWVIAWGHCVDNLTHSHNQQLPSYKCKTADILVLHTPADILALYTPVENSFSKISAIQIPSKG